MIWRDEKEGRNDVFIYNLKILFKNESNAA